MDGKVALDAARRLSIIDISSFDDCLLDSFSGLDSDDPVSDSFANSCEDEKTSCEKVSEGIEPFPMVGEPQAINQMKKATNCNLRKSLAWNSAFFASEGVLDAEELAIISKTSKKALIPCLPEIDEDLTKSAESNTTGSESRALENLEVDLFEDLKASMERSFDEEGDKYSDVSSCCSRNGLEKIVIPPSTSIQKGSFSSQSKTPTPLKKQASSRPPLHRKPKEVVPRPGMSAVKTGDQKSVSKCPKIILRTQPNSVIRDQRMTSTVRSTRSCTGAGNRSPATISVKPTLLNPVPSKIMPPLLCSPKQKILSGNSRKKSEFCLPQSSDSKSKTPVRVSAKKTEIFKLKHAKILAAPSNYPSISPSSSIDSLSSEASSSTSTANQILRSKLDIHLFSSNSQSKTSSSIHVANKLTDEKGKPESEKREFIASARGPISGNSSLSRSSTKMVSRSKVDDGVRLQLKPSGLRMPSPKIGFFDAEKHALRISKVIPNVLQGNMARDEASAIFDSEKSVGSYTAHETLLLDSEKENRLFSSQDGKTPSIRKIQLKYKKHWGLVVSKRKISKECDSSAETQQHIMKSPNLWP